MAEAKGLNYKGSQNGDIKTPMCAENVDNQGDGKIHSYKGVANTSESGGKGGSDIEGPGAKGQWTASIKISGTNTGKY